MSLTPKNPGQVCLHLTGISNFRAKSIRVLLNPTLQDSPPTSFCLLMLIF